MILVIVSVLLDIACIVLKCVSLASDDDKHSPVSIATEEYRSLDPLLYTIIGVSFILLVRKFVLYVWLICLDFPVDGVFSLKGDIHKEEDINE